jgi:hypothetical protein
MPLISYLKNKSRIPIPDFWSSKTLSKQNIAMILCVSQKHKSKNFFMWDISSKITIAELPYLALGIATFRGIIELRPLLFLIFLRDL